MIRSTPPASAHLAESPVPAPAPMIACPRPDLARAAARAPRRGSSGAPSGTRRACLHHRGRERRVVDVEVELAPPRSARRRSRTAVNSASSAAGSWNDCPRRDHRDAAQRDEEGGRAGRGVSFAPIRGRAGALLRRRAHQRDRGVVDVQVAARGTVRDGLARPEVDHVERAERDDLRDARRPAASSRSGPAENTPPTSSSHSSVVVTSSTPRTKPASISDSIEPPPVPVVERAPRSRAPRAPRGRS